MHTYNNQTLNIPVSIKSAVVSDEEPNIIQFKLQSKQTLNPEHPAVYPYYRLVNIGLTMNHTDIHPVCIVKIILQTENRTEHAVPCSDFRFNRETSIANYKTVSTHISIEFDFDVNIEGYQPAFIDILAHAKEQAINELISTLGMTDPNDLVQIIGLSKDLCVPTDEA